NTNKHMLTEINTQQFIVSSALQVELDNNLVKMNNEYERLNPKSCNSLNEIDETFDPEMCQICEQKVAAVKCMTDHLEQELSANNPNYII
ncbi:7300_t:CDS:1, partial [Cetraspora pellucida]